MPEYRVDFERPKRCAYAVCVFVINEGEKIRKQLIRMKPFVNEADVIVADGGSTDGSLTGELFEAADATAFLVKTGAGKLSAQMRMALAWVMQRGYEGVIVIDGNGKDGVEAIPEFITRLKAGWDHVQGSRFVSGGIHQHTPLSRLLAVRLLHAPLVSAAARFRYTDTTNGFRAYSRRFLMDPKVQPFREVFSCYELHYYLSIRAARKGFRVCEIPVSRVYPATGVVPTKISPLRGNLLVFRTLLSACFGRYNPSSSQI
ncbi:MAG: glycosyltransferase family 2 protein [Verrucomicrobiaceae bacterium]|nr:MAG: glycosyltransferase family 2 protein [Verrucomicrobiaceae bacterium]